MQSLSNLRRTNRRDVLALSAVLVFGLLLRVAYLAFGTGRQPLKSDALQYFEIARNVAAGKGFSNRYPGLLLHATAFRPPGYPLLLSGFFAVFGPSAGLARGINVVLGLGVIALTYGLLRRHVSFTAALAGSLAVAVMPNLIANDTYVLDEPMALCLMLGLIWALLARRWWLSGALCGLLVLTRPSAQFFVLVLAVWVLVRADWRSMLRFVAVAFLVVSPWLVRNWIQVGSPVLVTSNGFNWAAIYSPAAQSAGVFIDPTTNPAYDKDRLLQFDELAWSNTLQSQGVHALEQHPTYVLHVVKYNAEAFFELRPSFNRFAELWDGRDTRILGDTLWVFYLELGIGAFGLVAARRTHLAQLFIIEGAYFTAASLLFIAAPRLRAPLDLALGVGVGLAADWLVQRRTPAPGTAEAGLEPGADRALEDHGT